ncbi:MAG: MotB family protein [Methylobacter sp.]|uniref:MotB family protein n=1 Tax=Methylobacter sp. TaxID=2051955 RepID=UPI0025836F24|nr:MotB family protein [Methylobacter sp.]MCL7423427.1 MotB family protein [Methylobacter sp.]
MADQRRPKCRPGAPAWLATFADLCTLLLCFFVLLLSSATQDVRKFKQIAGSMKSAFGVQNEVFQADTPMGTSVIEQNFSPSLADPAMLDEVRQAMPEQSLTRDTDIEALKKQVMAAKLAEIEDEAENIRELLKEEIRQGLVSVEANGLKIVMRIQEKGSFPSGSAELQSGFAAVMDKITAAAAKAKGLVQISGHTDDVPITNSSYRSNWELASSRAVTVALHMLHNNGIAKERVVVQGYADTQPLVPNTSEENRARNRRVEVVIVEADPTLELERKKLADADSLIDADKKN